MQWNVGSYPSDPGTGLGLTTPVFCIQPFVTAGCCTATGAMTTGATAGASGAGAGAGAGADTGAGAGFAATGAGAGFTAD